MDDGEWPNDELEVGLHEREPEYRVIRVEMPLANQSPRLVVGGEVLAQEVPVVEGRREHGENQHPQGQNYGSPDAEGPQNPVPAELVLYRAAVPDDAVATVVAGLTVPSGSAVTT